MLRSGFGLLILVLMLWSCMESTGDVAELPPVLGEVSVNALNRSLNQNALISQTGLQYDKLGKGKIHVVDFFFTSCPTICPKMTSHLKRVQQHFSGNEYVEILSYSIDGANDTPEVLEDYAEAYGINADQWKLLTGNPQDIFQISKEYKVRAFDDSVGEDRNLLHDGTFVLLDRDRRIRGYYNGLDLEDTERMITDIEKLIKTL